MLSIESFTPSAPPAPPAPTPSVLTAPSVSPTPPTSGLIIFGLPPLAHDFPSPEVAELLDWGRKGQPHELRHHFEHSCVRELIGLLDTLASKNPRRFVRWEAIKVAMKRCRRREGKNKGKRYSARTIQRSFQALRDTGIIRKTKDCWGKGYIVADHKDVTRLAPDGWCELLIDFNGQWAQISGRKNRENQKNQKNRKE